MQLCRRDASRLGCALSWRAAARRVTLDSENHDVPHMITVCGANGATVLRDNQTVAVATRPWTCKR